MLSGICRRRARQARGAPGWRSRLFICPGLSSMRVAARHQLGSMPIALSRWRVYIMSPSAEGLARRRWRGPEVAVARRCRAAPSSAPRGAAAAYEMSCSGGGTRAIAHALAVPGI